MEGFHLALPSNNYSGAEEIVSRDWQGGGRKETETIQLLFMQEVPKALDAGAGRLRLGKHSWIPCSVPLKVSSPWKLFFHFITS